MIALASLAIGVLLGLLQLLITRKRASRAAERQRQFEVDEKIRLAKEAYIEALQSQCASYRDLLVTLGVDLNASPKGLDVPADLDAETVTAWLDAD